MSAMQVIFYAFYVFYRPKMSIFAKDKHKKVRTWTRT